MGETLELFWDDLTPEAQQKIIDAFGDNCNFDVIPFCILYNGEEGG